MIRWGRYDRSSEWTLELAGFASGIARLVYDAGDAAATDMLAGCERSIVARDATAVRIAASRWTGGETKEVTRILWPARFAAALTSEVTQPGSRTLSQKQIAHDAAVLLAAIADEYTQEAAIVLRAWRRYVRWRRLFDYYPNHLIKPEPWHDLVTSFRALLSVGRGDLGYKMLAVREREIWKAAA